MNLAGAVGGAVDGGVVDDDQLVVGGQPDVELDGAEAEIDGVVEAGDGVFRGFEAGAAMADDLGMEAW